ncbi:heparan-sulfate 6-O-sulfotransferase 2-like [Gordionus sp. m RMFG-2023]|uniref:heparan-sulfate 6-O-sulfotransferase 2-like n=1 Tax=Gordionus sp. m RMFG-2023 TaxID=3053472 RepID=UPI0031FD7CBF
MKRYLSEYYQILNGSHWGKQYILCEKDVLIGRPTCFAHIQKFSELTLEEFVSCQNQWTNNRMTRHLADMSIIEWHLLYIFILKLMIRKHIFLKKTTNHGLSTEQRNQIMLDSAKINLQLGLKVFGITEYMPQTIYLFEKVLGISFTNKELLKNKVSKSEECIKHLESRYVDKNSAK